MSNEVIFGGDAMERWEEGGTRCMWWRVFGSRDMDLPQVLATLRPTFPLVNATDHRYIWLRPYDPEEGVLG